jgi:plasmid rolling circle replication initiator protein Rep
MNKYNEMKRRNQVLVKFADKFATPRMFKLFSNCGSWTQFLADYEEEHHKLTAANHCGWRFCSTCAWRKALADTMRLGVLMSYIAQEHHKDFIMVTLTAPNVKGHELRDEITRFNRAFKNLVDREEIMGMNEGYLRKLEVTYNRERDDYHPHFHVVFVVNPGYFSGGRYMKQAQWLDLWRDVMGDDSITQVDVRRVKRRKDSKDMATFDTAEYAKYVAKDSDFTHSEAVFAVFYKALKGRQQLTYAGLFATANKLYENDELSEYIKPDNTIYCWEVFYKWVGVGKEAEYVKHKKRALDAGDKLFLAQCGIKVKVVGDDE